MSEGNRPIKAIIEMACEINNSGKVGQTGSKTEAEEVVRSLVGGADKDFAASFGLNYWNYLKGMLSDYAISRGLEGRYVVKGTPFNWHASVGTKCGAVILRKDFFRGDQRVEPELYLEAGLLPRAGGLFPGIACGFHYLSSAEGDRSGFVQGVLSDGELKDMAWNLSNDGFTNPSFAARGVDGFWTVEAALFRSWQESALPSDIRAEVFRALDDLLPFYRRLTALQVP